MLKYLLKWKRFFTLQRFLGLQRLPELNRLLRPKHLQGVMRFFTLKFRLKQLFTLHRLLRPKQLFRLIRFFGLKRLPGGGLPAVRDLLSCLWIQFLDGNRVGRHAAVHLFEFLFAAK